MNGLTQAKAKQIRALRQKKGREESGFFLVEGAKAVLETLRAGWPVQTLLATPEFLAQLEKDLTSHIPEILFCSGQALSETGNFSSNNAALLVACQKSPQQVPDSNADCWLVLENISDPGNLGTLIRLADWFGLSEIVCLGACVEWYNPKVVSSSMGSFLRISQVKLSNKELINSGRVLLAAGMSGGNLYEFSFPAKMALLIGNEASGLSPAWLQPPAVQISIPSFGRAESLNAAMAGGILLSHWKKQSLQK